MNLSSITAWLKTNWLTSTVAAIVLLALLWYFGGSIKQKVQDFTTDRKVEKLEKQANDSQQKADAQISEADKASGARAAEDERRETEIRPAINRAAQDRQQARLNTQKAQADYENSKRNLGNANPDLRVLHDSNCADFRDLYGEDCPR
jgi:hypothetical protein